MDNQISLLNRRIEQQDRLLLMFFFMFVLLIGALMNFKAMNAAVGKMPILCNDDFSTWDRGYTCYPSIKEMKQEIGVNWILSDIIATENKRSSIGDFVMILSIISISVLFIKTLVRRSENAK